MTRTLRLLECGVKPVYVFDGKPPGIPSLPRDPEASLESLCCQTSKPKPNWMSVAPDLKGDVLKGRDQRKQESKERLEKAIKEGNAEEERSHMLHRGPDACQPTPAT